MVEMGERIDSQMSKNLLNVDRQCDQKAELGSVGKPDLSTRLSCPVIQCKTNWLKLIDLELIDCKTVMKYACIMNTFYTITQTLTLMRWDQLANTHMQPINNFEILQNPHAHSASCTVMTLRCSREAAPHCWTCSVRDTAAHTPSFCYSIQAWPWDALSLCLWCWIEHTRLRIYSLDWRTYHTPGLDMKSVMRQRLLWFGGRCSSFHRQSITEWILIYFGRKCHTEDGWHKQTLLILIVLF